MLVTVEIPDHVAKEFHLDEAPRTRELWEAFLLQRYAEGKISAGRLGEALGLSFDETEQCLRDHGAAPNVTPEEQAEDVAALERLLA